MIDENKLSSTEKTFWQLIRSLKEMGISYTLMAKLSGVSYTKVSNFVNGRGARILSEDIKNLRILLEKQKGGVKTEEKTELKIPTVTALLELNELRKQKEEELDKEIEELQKRNAELEEKLAFYKSIVERIENEKK